MPEQVPRCGGFPVWPMSGGDHGHFPPPPTLKGFPNAVRSKAKTPRDGGGLRTRWENRASGAIYEWDYRHGTVEVYDKRGWHEGEADANTGKMIKGRDPTRRIEP